MKGFRNPDLSRYNGYLKPYLTEIVRLHEAGYKPSQIALHLPVTGGPWGGPVDAMVYTALQRVFGLDRRLPESPYGVRMRVPPAAELAALLRIRGDWRLYLAGPGRPLDMGGPRDVWIERSPWDDW